MPGCHHCHTDNALVAERTDGVFRRILWFALIINGGMFVVEIIASQIGGSVSLQADALDFFADAANYAISLFVIGMAVTARAKASLFKGATMALFGLFVVTNAIYRAIFGGTPDPSIMGSIALLALIANLSVALLLFKYRAGDSNMQSIWLCSRNDAIGNLAVLIAAAGVFASATRWPDLIVAAIVASLSLSSAYKVIRLANQEIVAHMHHTNL